MYYLIQTYDGVWCSGVYVDHADAIDQIEKWLAKGTNLRYKIIPRTR